MMLALGLGAIAIFWSAHERASQRREFVEGANKRRRANSEKLRASSAFKPVIRRYEAAFDAARRNAARA